MREKSNNGYMCGCNGCLSVDERVDDINSPSHYIAQNGVECIDVIEALGLDHHLATAFAYIWRSGFKGTELKDIRKARWYLDRKISLMEDSDSGE